MALDTQMGNNEEQPTQQQPTESPSNASNPQPTQNNAPSNNSTSAASNILIFNSPLKRHRIRSRSMPNLIFYDAYSKIHKQPTIINQSANSATAFLNPKYLSTSNIPPPAPSSKKFYNRKHKRQQSPYSISPTTILNTNAIEQVVIQAPPVNSQSLREIDLQEIFKNPQLRHDIIFDPQLQFRPNLDGERGKRKRVIAERYWDSIVNEFQDFALISNNNYDCLINSNSKLPLLFHTMKDILISLLPIKDRPYVESILDPDLLIQQLNHKALDFEKLANWLAGVFKAHCAPMRDSWVDQMVQRIQAGAESKSPRRLVEGLRMIFAILEAMKLDVANHQIRTLRPMLVETAIEFEQDYYTQIVDKGKLNLNDSLEWYKNSLKEYKGDCNDLNSNRSSFIFAILRLFSCASQEIVCEFPSTFGFDFSRLASFRAELRKIVCLNLCIGLYQQMIQASNLDPMNSSDFDKFKLDLLSIIEDSLGNCKWTKNTHLLALEISKRVEQASNPSTTLPDSNLIDLASNWLSKHLQPKSGVYKLLETKFINTLFNILNKAINIISPLDSTTTCATMIGQSNNNMSSPLHKELVSLADKILVLIRFHWGVFGKFYVTYLTVHADDDTITPTSCINTSFPKHNNTHTNNNNEQEDDEDDELMDDEDDGEISSHNKIRQSSTSAC